MLHPVGNLPAYVYWRRRMYVVGLPLLVIITAWAVFSGGGGKHSPVRAAASTTTAVASRPPTTSPAPRDSGSISVTTSTTPPPTTTPPTTTPAKTTPAKTTPPASGRATCLPANLTVTPGAAHKTFPLKSRPTLYMEVTNKATTACRLDVADKHVEWRIYSGDVRVWGSHDCAIEAGTDVVTLKPNRTVRLSIVWSGLTSRPACAGTRINVEAGTYTLYAYLNGVKSPATTFVIGAP